MLLREGYSDEAESSCEDGGGTVDDGEDSDDCDTGEDDFDFHTLPIGQKTEGAKAAL